MLVCLGSDGAIRLSVHINERARAGEELGQRTTDSMTFSAEQCCHPVATLTAPFWNPELTQMAGLGSCPNTKVPWQHSLVPVSDRGLF